MVPEVMPGSDPKGGSRPRGDMFSQFAEGDSCMSWCHVSHARMFNSSLFLIPLLLMLFASGCSNRRTYTVNTFAETSGGIDRAAATDTVIFAARLAEHTALPLAEQAALREAAEDKASDWRDFEAEARVAKDSRLRHWFYRYDHRTYDTFGIGLGNSIIDLKEATTIDPSYAEGLGNLGRLCTEVGDWESGRRYLEHALLAAGAEARAGRSLADEEQLKIYRNLAWTYRDLALWEMGLTLVEQGLELYPTDHELHLIKGLLLAGNGQYEKAISLAVNLEPVSYPQYTYIYRGLHDQNSSYANNWIKSQALLARGELQKAYNALGDLPTYAYRVLLPYSSRYWRDAGLVAELADDPKAPTYYGVGYVTRDYARFYPVMARNVAPQVLGVPDSNMPVYTSYGSRFLVAGSPLSYVGVQINRMSRTLFEGQRTQAAGQAMQMLEILERRHIRPAVCRALRGRILYANDDFNPARAELKAAHAAFAAQGKVDAGTSLLLGLLHMQRKEYDPAVPLLNETVAADPLNPVAWRTLGVANARLGRIDPARKAMDQAVVLDPWAVTSYYNRGLFHLQMEEFTLARQDLERAYGLDPENREVQRLLQMAAVSEKGVDPDGQVVTARDEGPPAGFEADPAQIMAQLEAEVEAMLSLPDSLRVDSPESRARFSELEIRYVVEPTPELRAVLALVYIDRNMDRDAQALLEPGWGVDLTPDEELMLLYADRNLGEIKRAEEVVQEVLASGSGAGNPYAVAIAVSSMRTGVNPVGEDWQAPAMRGFFGFWLDARFNYDFNHIDRPKTIWGMYLLNKYADDPMFEQAVWGLKNTPFGGGGGGK